MEKYRSINSSGKIFIAHLSRVGIVAIVFVVVSSLLYAQTPEDMTDPQSFALSGIHDAVAAGDYGNVHSVVALQGGQLMAEWYFEGMDERWGSSIGAVAFDADTLHDLRSVTKSIVALLFGIALDEGAVGSLEDSLETYFSDEGNFRRPEHSAIQLRHLLSMTSGIRWDERTYPYTDHRNSETALYFADDRLQLILSEPIVRSPGERFNYSGGDVELIARVIERATQTPLVRYAADNLFGPLGIEDYEWLEYPSGGPIVASGLRMRPLDVAKLGQLVLQNGRWEGQQIVSEAWIRESTSVKVPVSGNGICDRQYGYFWWLGAFCNGDQPVQFPLADGNGGQRIFVVSELDTVIVTTAGFYNSDDRPSDEVAEAVLAALQERNPDR